MPPLSATGPVQVRNRDVNDPATGALRARAAAPGSFTSRFRVSVWPCCSEADRARDRPGSSAERVHFCRERRRSDRGLFGSEGARQGFPPFRRRCAALTRAMRSRCSGQLSERRRAAVSPSNQGWSWIPDAIQEFGHLNDLDAFVPPEVEKVRISGHDQLGLRGDSALQHAVVVRISLDDVQGHGGNDGCGRSSDQAAASMRRSSDHRNLSRSVRRTSVRIGSEMATSTRRVIPSWRHVSACRRTRAPTRRCWRRERPFVRPLLAGFFLRSRRSAWDIGLG